MIVSIRGENKCIEKLIVKLGMNMLPKLEYHSMKFLENIYQQN